MLLFIIYWCVINEAQVVLLLKKKGKKKKMGLYKVEFNSLTIMKKEIFKII